MKLFRFLSRPAQNPTQIPAVSSSIAHLIGPGKLHVDNGRLAFTTTEATQLMLEPAGLECLLCHGSVSLSAEALAMAAEHEIALTLLDAWGNRVIARLEPNVDSRAIGRILQHRVLNSESSRRILARDVVLAKIRSQQAAVRHYQRQGRPDTNSAIDKLAELETRCESAVDVDELRGLEGAASAIWFARLAGLLQRPWTFSKRIRRPPADPVNALLSFGYTLLHNRTASRAQAVGLELAVGSLHAFRPGRLSLACDLMEPLRVTAVDRWVIRLCNQRRILPEDFRQTGDVRPAVLLTDRGRSKVLADWEDHWHASHFDTVLDQSVTKFSGSLRKLCADWPGLKRAALRAGVQADAELVEAYELGA